MDNELKKTMDGMFSKIIEAMKKDTPELFISAEKIVASMEKPRSTISEYEQYVKGMMIMVRMIDEEKVPREVKDRFYLIWAIAQDRLNKKVAEKNEKMASLKL